MVTVKEIAAKSILRTSGTVDPWFISRAGMNLYRGCAHACAYCDGRAEKYRVEGDFGSDIQAKINAVEILRKELGPDRSAQPELWPGEQNRSGGFLLLGGGVGDSYQPAEERRGLARGVLQLFAERRRPVHVLTKSSLVLRDADLLERIAMDAGALVSFSLSTSDDATAALLEPGAPPPSDRLRALESFARRGIPGGVFLMPVIPFLTDSARAIDRTVAAACSAGARYVLFGGLTMKGGRQRDHFLAAIEAARPGLRERIDSLYPGPEPGRPDWGSAVPGYYAEVSRRFAAAARKHGIPPRIPRELFEKTVSPAELAGILHEHARCFREREQ